MGQTRKKINSVLLSYDMLGALLMSGVVCFFLPEYINAEFTTSFYSVGISVLSIIFSLFFAALAVIMASSDTDFIEFMEEKGRFTFLMYTFKVTLIMLFISLSYSIVVNAYTDYWIKKAAGNSTHKSHKIYFVLFVFLFTYSMIATGLSIKDTFMFTKFRLKFIESEKKRKEAESRR